MPFLSKQFKQQRGVTVLIAIVILASIIILVTAVSDLVVRSSQTAQDIGFSEVAYYAADTAIEKALYVIEREHSALNLAATNISLADVSGATWSRQVTALTQTNVACASVTSGLCVNGDQLTVKLAVDKSFQLDLDFSGLDYSTAINFRQNFGVPAALVVLGKDGAQNTFELGPGVEKIIELSNTAFVRLINQDTTSSIEIQLSPSGGSGNIPIGIIVQSTGIYQDQQRQIRMQRLNWQVY